MSNRLVPYITPTVDVASSKKEGFYHYNAADDKEMYRKWVDYPQKGIVKRVPIQLDLETTASCNLQCPMCFHSEDETRPIVGQKSIDHMPFELYTHILDEFGEKGGASVKLMYRGDPLVTKNIDQWVQYATDRGVQSRFNTNGQLLDKELSEKLVRAGLRQILFSIDSHIPEEYNQIRRPSAQKEGNFYKVVENVENLARIRDSTGSKYPIIEISRVNLPETRKSLPDFKDFWLEHGADHVTLVGLNDYSMGKSGKLLVSDEFCCEMPWQRMFVLSDGRVTACCGDLYQQYPYAQIATPAQIEDYKKALNSSVATRKGDNVSVSIIQGPKLEKIVMGKFNGSEVNPTRMRIRGITGNINTVPIVTSIEKAWKGKLAQHMRDVNSEGEAEKIKACADCGYRQTVIKNMGMKSRLVDRKMEQSKTGQTSYMIRGLKRE